MYNFFKLVAMLIAISSLTACAGAGSINGSVVPGFIYADVKLPGSTTTSSGQKTGTACAKSILGWVASGDASIEAAKKNGAITQVSTVDHSMENTLGIIAEYCTVVTGK